MPKWPHSHQISLYYYQLLLLFALSLHDEVVAQRALDRKLTAELNRFRGKIGSLTE